MKKLIYILNILFAISISVDLKAINHSNDVPSYILTEHKFPFKRSEAFFFDQENNQKSLEEYDNNVVILHFWATWCTFCKAEMKNLSSFYKQIKNLPIKIVAISEDFKGVEVVKSFYEKNKITNLEIFIDKKNALYRQFNITALPTTVIINPQGLEESRILGPVQWEKDEKVKNIILNLNK